MEGELRMDKEGRKEGSQSGSKKENGAHLFPFALVFLTLRQNDQTPEVRTQEVCSLFTSNS